MSLLGYTLSVSVPEARADSAAKSPLGREIEAKTRGRKFDFSAEPNMSKEELECDVMVAGGGLAGICAALAAALEMSRQPEWRGKTLVVLLPDSGERYLSTWLFENI